MQPLTAEQLFEDNPMPKQRYRGTPKAKAKLLAPKRVPQAEEERLKPPEPNEFLNIHKKLKPRNSTLSILELLAVSNGKLITTDLETRFESPTNRPDGVYEFIGKELFPTKSDPSEFPMLPDMKVIAQFEGSAALTAALVEAVAFTRTEPLRPALSNVLLEPANVVATDGHVLYHGFPSVKVPKKQKILVPRKFIELLRLAKPDQYTVIVRGEKDVLWLEASFGARLLGAMCTDPYPNWSSVIPTSAQFNLIINRAEFLEKTKYVAQFVSTRMERMEVTIEEDALQLYGEDLDFDRRMSQPVRIQKRESPTAPQTNIRLIMPMRLEDGKKADNKFGINPWKLQTILESLDAEEMKLHFDSATRALVFSRV